METLISAYYYHYFHWWIFAFAVGFVVCIYSYMDGHEFLTDEPWGCATSYFFLDVGVWYAVMLC